MTFVVFIECTALVVLLVLSAFFSSAETALFSLDSIQLHRVRRRRPESATILEGLLATPTQLLSTILIGNTLVNVIAAGLGYVIINHLVHSYAEAIAIPVMTLLLLIFGEVAPKRLAIAHAERMAAYYSPVLAFLAKALAPLRAVLNGIAALFSKHLRADSRTLTEDEFLTVVEVGEEEGVLDEEERTMVDGIIRLEEIQASDVMTPRVDLVGIDLEDPIEESGKTARRVTYRFLPVYRESLDHIEGLLDVPHFLLAPQSDLGAATTPPLFVPETVPLDTLLATFQREDRRVAIVVDEFGGTAGLVTRGDILEEIVPDVDNEYGEAEVTIQQVADQRWMIDGTTSLDEVNRELDTHLEAEGADRMSGWVSAVAERIPRAGEVVEAQGCRATVQRVRKTRISLVMLERLPEDDGMTEDMP